MRPLLPFINNYILRWIFFACFFVPLAAAESLFAQHNELKFRTLTSQDGLSSSRTLCVTQDKHGFIWVGTYDGLNVYNGYEFKTYKHDKTDPYSLSNNYILSLLYDKKGRLWVGTPEGLNLYDAKNENFIRYQQAVKPGSRNSTIHWIYEDQEHTIWVGTSEGMNFFNEKTQQLEFPAFLNETLIPGQVTTLLQDKTGLYWIGTEGGLYTYLPTERKYRIYKHDPGNPHSIAHNNITDLFEDSRGNIWIGTAVGLELYKAQDSGFEHFKLADEPLGSTDQNYIKDVVEDQDGKLWIGLKEGGVGKFDVGLQTFERHVKDPNNLNSLADNAVMNLFIDKTGGLWVTCFRGLNFLDDYQMKFDHLEHMGHDSKSLTDNFVTALFKDSKGNIWAGNRYGISLFNPKTKSFKHYKHDPADKTTISDGAVLLISEDAEGNFWCITHRGVLNKFNRKKETFTRYFPDPQNKGGIEAKSRHVLGTKDGNVWISFMRGISRYDKRTDTFRHYYIPDSSAIGNISFLYEDSQQNLITVGREAIYKFDKEAGVFSLVRKIPESLLPFQATQAFEDKQQNIWIGSAYKGLLMYHPNKDGITIYTNKGDLPDIFIEGMLEDKEGNLWLSSNNGIYKFNPATIEYTYYGLADGLKNAEFNHRVCVQANDGKMYFGGNNGITAFYPDRISNNPIPPQVVITNFQLFNKTVPIAKDSPLKQSITETDYIALDHKQSVLSFEFVGLNYNSPEKNRYAYRMVGFDQDWNYSGSRRHATYTNLPSGKTYTFQVKASNNDGVWNEAGTSIEIYIKPPFWATWWFYTLLACFALSALWLLYYWRTRQHFRQRRKLERKVKERTEEVEAQKEALAAHADHLKQANAEIKLKNKKIRRQSNRLKALDQLKSKFLANISHELRTPLTLILVPLEEMLSAVQAEGDDKNQLSVMNRNARRLHQLINQLLDLSKLEGGSLPLTLVQENILSFLKSITSSFEPLARRHQIDFQFSCDKESIIAPFDVDKLEKITYNLLSNAFKFTPDGGSVHISVETIELTETEAATANVVQREWVQINVSDTGSGISAEHLPHIFDRFYQAEASLVRKSEGTGIGLALTKELVELHGGNIKVKSEQGQGTCFTVQLPLTAPVAAALPADLKKIPIRVVEDITVATEDSPLTEAVPQVLAASGEEVPLLLVVEDNHDLRQQIKRIFSKQFRVEEAADGIEGWTKASELLPDFIISDVMMPGKDGLALCSQLKNSPATSHIPTILLSARIDGEEAGLLRGADDYITKPFNAKTLLLKVRNLLETRHHFREAICQELGVQPIGNPSEGQPLLNKHDKDFLEQASSIAMENMNNPEFDMEAFYRELGMSRSLVYNKLKSLTGLGPNEFIRRIRLNKASKLLLEGNCTIAEVMYEVGFNHRSYFVKCFKAEFGHLPSEHTLPQAEDIPAPNL